MKKFVFLIGFSLMILATLLLAGCGNQNAFAGQAPTAPQLLQLAGSNFKCSEGTACGFVDQNDLSKALGNYVDQQGLSNALSGYVQTGYLRANYWDASTVQTQIAMLRRDIRSLPGGCVTVSADHILRFSGTDSGTGNSFCQNYRGYFQGVRNMSYPICVTVESETNHTYFNTSRGQCSGGVQLVESVTRLSSCEQIVSPVTRTYCPPVGFTQGFSEPKLGDFKFTQLDRSVTCCRIGS